MLFSQHSRKHHVTDRLYSGYDKEPSGSFYKLLLFGFFFCLAIAKAFIPFSTGIMKRKTGDIYHRFSATYTHEPTK